MWLRVWGGVHCTWSVVRVRAWRAVGFLGPEHAHTRDQRRSKDKGIAGCAPSGLGRAGKVAPKAWPGVGHTWGSCPEPPRGLDVLTNSADAGG